jgi:cell division protein ZapA
MSKAVEVEIMGQVFSVKSDDGEEHLRQVARYVDRKMRELNGDGRAVSSYTTAVLAALNIASECQKLQESNTEIDEVIHRLAARLHEGLEDDRGV